MCFEFLLRYIIRVVKITVWSVNILWSDCLNNSLSQLPFTLTFVVFIITSLWLNARLSLHLSSIPNASPAPRSGIFSSSVTVFHKKPDYINCGSKLCLMISRTQRNLTIHSMSSLRKIFDLNPFGVDSTIYIPCLFSFPVSRKQFVSCKQFLIIILV